MILITIISWDYLSLANEYVGDVTIPTQVIKYNQFFLQVDQPIRLQYSHQIKLYSVVGYKWNTVCFDNLNSEFVYWLFIKLLLFVTGKTIKTTWTILFIAMGTTLKKYIYCKVMTMRCYYIHNISEILIFHAPSI